MRTVDILWIYSLSLYGHLIEGSSLLLVPLTSVDGNGGAAVKLLYFLPLLSLFSSSSFYLTAFLLFFPFCFSPSSHTSYDIFVRQIITDTDVRTFTERQSAMLLVLRSVKSFQLAPSHYDSDRGLFTLKSSLRSVRFEDGTFDEPNPLANDVSLGKNDFDLRTERFIAICS